MRTIIFMLIIMLTVFSISAQSVFTGNIINEAGEPIVANITVQIKESPIVSAFSTSNSEGKYSITFKGVADSITIIVSNMLVGKHDKTVSNRSQQVDFIIHEKPLTLKEVTINAFKIERNKDTLNYIVGAFSNQNDQVIGDVLKKMPGIEVTENGEITFNGQNISKFYVENLDLLHGKYGLATNNIPAKAVSVVQVLENHQPIKTLVDKIPTNDVAINLRLKENAKGTLTINGLLGGGYQPILWNAEFTAMYFNKQMQDMSIYKGNNSGDNVASEFRTHYDYERIYMAPGSLLEIQAPSTPPIPSKRYNKNCSHAVTTNHLIKPNINTELTTAVLYYNDRIEKEGYSLYEQYLPSAENIIIEERIQSVNHIHNAELASRLNINTDSYYLNNALNVNANWNKDIGTGNTYSNKEQSNSRMTQQLNQPFISIDNTLNIIKTVKQNSYNVHCSIGYGHKPHNLIISPVTYWENEKFSSLSQEVLARNIASILRMSYSRNIKKFRLNYAIWGRADIRNMNTELSGQSKINSIYLSADSLRNNLWYNTYQGGLSQSYDYNSDNFKVTLKLPFTYHLLTNNDKIFNINDSYNHLMLSPSLTLKYEYNDFVFYTQNGISKNFGDMNSSYTGFIMHNYRSLLRNTMNELLESRSINSNASISYKNAFKALFINISGNYKYAWKNILYGYNYRDIIKMKHTINHPAATDNYDINIKGSKGLNFLSSTLRIFSNYQYEKRKQLIQNEILNSRLQNYGAGGNLDTNPTSFLSIGYSIVWNHSKSYVKEQSSDFTPIKRTSQKINIHIFPTKTVTVNFNLEHQYNSIASSRYTTFADTEVKWKNKHIDIELEVNNLFNTRQYISASYSDVSTYYYCYNLRPVSALLKFRFKLK